MSATVTLRELVQVAATSGMGKTLLTRELCYEF